MKKFMAMALAASSLALVCAGAADTHTMRYAQADESLTVGCKSSCLVDQLSGEVIYEENALDRMPIASVCKVMTLTLCFDAMKDGAMNAEDTITVSENAAGMGGSQVFLQSGASYPVGELIKSIVVCSANDSCVALSETVSGSEENFVAAMNKKAEELGCQNTLFSNCTGLPRETQYSCARDVAVMFSNLINHEEYFEYSKIWLEDFKHPGDRVTSMTNTNKLIKRYPRCDGGKTGFTNEAGFCLAATAMRDNLRLVAVVLGGRTSDDRFDSAVSLFNYGFANYVNKMVLDSSVNLNDKLPVRGARKESVSIRPERDSFVFCRREENPDITFNVITGDAKAPLLKGDRVGKIEIYKDGIMCDCVELVCAEDAPRASYGDNIRRIADDWCL